MKEIISHKETVGTISVITATIITGLNVYLAKIASFINWLLLASITLTLAGLILTLINFFFGKVSEILKSGKKYFLKLLWIGAVGTTVPMGMTFYGLRLSPISNTFLLQTEVLYSMILSYILLGERISRRQFFLSLLAFLGVFLITSEGTLRWMSLGDLLFLLAPFFFQCAHVVAKNLMQIISPLTVVMYRHLIGGLASLLIFMLFGSNHLEDALNIPLRGIIIILCISLSYVTGNSLWYYGIKNINLSKATAIMITYPTISVILAVITLGEKLSSIKFIGIIIVFFSILELSLSKTSKRKP
ncbi:MAG: DMT family transporter [Candidatus Bathyarchaeia archaeon]